MFHMSSSSDSTDSSVRFNSRLARRVDFWGLLIKDSRTRSTVSGDDPALPVLFAAHKQPVSSNFLYHSLIVLSVGASVWYLARKPCCTMFPHYCLLVVKWVTKPWHKTQEENLIIYSFQWHALVPRGRVCLWAIDLRNPGGNYETHCISEHSVYTEVQGRMFHECTECSIFNADQLWR
jgi:hypothetical protein